MTPDRSRIGPREGMSFEQRECFSLLLELSVAFEGRAERVYLVGGWAVYVLTEVFMEQRGGRPFRHRESLDIDLAVGSPSITAEEAAATTDTLRALGYEGSESLRWHRQLARNVSTILRQ